MSSRERPGKHACALQVASGTAKTGSSTATRSRKEQPRTKSRESLQAAAMAAAAANAPRDASDEEDDGPDRMGGPTMMDGAPSARSVP